MIEKVIAKLYEDYALGKARAEEIDLLLPKYRKIDGEKVQSIEIYVRFIGSLPDGTGK